MLRGLTGLSAAMLLVLVPAGYFNGILFSVSLALMFCNWPYEFWYVIVWSPNVYIGSLISDHFVSRALLPFPYMGIVRPRLDSLSRYLVINSSFLFILLYSLFYLGYRQFLKGVWWTDELKMLTFGSETHNPPCQMGRIRGFSGGFRTGHTTCIHWTDVCFCELTGNP